MPSERPNEDTGHRDIPQWAVEFTTPNDHYGAIVVAANDEMSARGIVCRMFGGHTRVHTAEPLGTVVRFTTARG